MSHSQQVKTKAYLLNDLLRDVSRSFFLTLKFLPKEVRPQIGLAYLLARATDTVADTEVLPVDQRLASLRELQSAIGSLGAKVNFNQLSTHQANSAERILLERINEALHLLHSETGESDRKFIQEVLEVITTGQSLDLIRFSAASPRHPAALETDAELDDYTWRVAGCVGDFWTKICVANLGNEGFKLPPSHGGKQKAEGAALKWILEKAISFGKGLQYVNILRDIPADLKNGRCYMPVESLSRLGLAPADLLIAQNWSRFQPLYFEYLARAEKHLASGWEYTVALPKKWMRVRLACAWPILIGMETIQKLKIANVLEADQRVKISRAEVRKIVAKSLFYYPFTKRWESLFSS